jgi:TonB family protein
MNLLLDSTVKVSLIVLVALVVRALLRRRSAAVRHWVLSVAIACAVAMPLLAMMVPAWHIGLGAFPASTTPSAAPPAAPSQSVVSTTTIVAQGPVATGRVGAGGLNTEGAASIGARMVGPIWMAGAGISLLILLAGLGHLKWLARSARQVDGGRWERLAKEISAAFELRHPVKLLQSDHPTLLVTWGLLQPKVILPAAARGWSDDRVRVVLRHELAHIRRGDWAVFMTAEVLRAVYWFNPLVWIACRRVRQESEHACDDVVLNAGMEGSDYATHLLDLARTLHATRRTLFPAFPGPAAPAMARPSSLEGRIRTMLNASVNRRPLTRSSRVVTFVALLGLTVLIAGLGAQSFFTLSGIVIDSTNRFLPDTKLVVTNAASKAKHEVRTDRTGHFEFLGLPPGEYGLEVSIPGFRTFKDTIPVVARNVDRTIQMEVGSLEETITVTGSVAGPPDPEPPADQAERRQQARSKAEARQRAALEKCGSAPAGPMGGMILAPLRLTNVNPRYPENLRTAGIGGVVTMDAVIGIDGNIQEVRAVSSPHPDLGSAAIEAVRQWQWTPTLLNCVPIEVPIKVTLRFNTQP